MAFADGSMVCRADSGAPFDSCHLPVSHSDCIQIAQRPYDPKTSYTKQATTYELWQAQCVDDHGVVDRTTFASHPWASNGEQRAEYVALGELSFIAKRWPIVRDAIRDNPLDFATRIKTRALAASLVYDPADYETRQPAWLLLAKQIAFALPFLGFVTIVLCAKRPLEGQIGTCLWIYSLFLLPYVLVSYYERYAMPLVGIKMLLVLYAFHVVFTRFRSSGTAQK